MLCFLFLLAVSDILWFNLSIRYNNPRGKMEKYYLAALTYINGCGSQKAKSLVKYFGNAKNVWQVSASELSALKILPATAITHFSFLQTSKIYDQIGKILEDNNIDIISHNDFPDELKQTLQSPVLLYVKGTLPVGQKLAVVGSRKATTYGLQATNKFVHELASAGIIIVSGGARGIDTAAHQAALKVGVPTIAVLGSGLDIAYPYENKNLFTEIALQGAVVSEYPLGTKPFAGHFPQRNRIISGFSNGVLMVEAAKSSGALITAEFALDNGRDVYCVPGNIFSSTSMGTHSLIKQGAKLVDSAEDILEDFNSLFSKPTPHATKEANLNLEQNLIYQCFNQQETLTVDEIIDLTKLSIPEVSYLLLELEINGYLFVDDNRNYQRRQVY